MYWCVFIFLLIGAILEIKTQKNNSLLFYIAYFVLVLLNVLRQGQGTDYYNYMEIYKEIEYYSQNSSISSVLLYRDPLYAMLNYIALSLGVSYKLFSAIVSFIIMALLYRFYKTICSKSMVSLFLLYSTFYLIYPFSGIRQGLAMAIVLGLLFPMIKAGKNMLLYYLGLLISIFIHSSVVICAILPFVYKLKIKHRDAILLVCMCGGIMLAGVSVIDLLPIPDYILSRGDLYDTLDVSKTKYLAMGVRIMAVLPVFLIPQSQYAKNKRLNGVKNILLVGFVVYSTLSYNELIASRMAIYFRMFEGLFLYLLLFESNLKRINKQICAYYLVLCSVLFTKDINSFIIQGDYRNCNILTYPYLTIFDSNETIMNYRYNLSSVDRIN